MKLKITGLRYSDNIRQIAELEPDYIAFIFYKNSRRFVGEEFVMPDLNKAIKKVGVFVNADAEYIFSIAERYHLDLIELHGNEDAFFCKKIAERFPVIKAFGVNQAFELKELDPYKEACNYFLFDNRSESFESSAEPFPWEKLMNYDNSVPVFIAGGMDHEKLKLLRSHGLRPFGVDITNKLEIKPGYKDIIRLIRFKNDLKHF